MKKWQKTCYSILIVLRRVPESGHKILTLIPCFSDYKRHPPPEFGRKMGVRLIVRMQLTFTLVKYYVIYVIKYLTTFFASKFFSYFPLKPRCILWSKKYSISSAKFQFMVTPTFREVVLSSLLFYTQIKKLWLLKKRRICIRDCFCHR